MWELDCVEGWMPKNLCFWTVVLEKTLESPLDYKEIQLVYSEGDQPWDFFGRNDAKAETPVLWPPHAKSWLIGKDSDAWRDWGQEEKGMPEDEMAGWNHWLDGRESEWTSGVGDGQGVLTYCDSRGHKESNTTEWLNWTELRDTNKMFVLGAKIAEEKMQSSHIPRIKPFARCWWRDHNSEADGRNLRATSRISGERVVGEMEMGLGWHIWAAAGEEKVFTCLEWQTYLRVIHWGRRDLWGLEDWG